MNPTVSPSPTIGNFEPRTSSPMVKVYTFRTCPFKDQLGEVFVLGKLKEDLAKFLVEVETEKPDWIVGVALGKKSRVEKLTVNAFNGKKKILKDGRGSFQLDTAGCRLFYQKNQHPAFVTMPCILSSTIWQSIICLSNIPLFILTGKMY